MSHSEVIHSELYETVRSICEKAKQASVSLRSLTGEQINSMLKDIASALIDNTDTILEENRKDLSLAEENGVPVPMLDRLSLSEKRIAGIASSIEEIVTLPSPLGAGECQVRPNGLLIRHTRVPLGVVAMIYEARPNVTADAASLCLKTGNSVVLKCGKEALFSSKAIVKVFRDVIRDHGHDPNAVSLIESRERQSANALMEMQDYVNVLIPRGGRGLIRSVKENSKVPVIETGAGNCHLYVDSSADLEMALKVAVNAKLSRPAVCNSIETLLVHRDVAEAFLPAFAEKTASSGLTILGCEKVLGILKDAFPATEEDFATEFDDLIISVKVVNDLDEAIEHIRKYSTGHSEAIITNSIESADRFTSSIDSAALYVNASTRFTDGGEFGLGAEIGISTQKLHVRGPMGLSALTTDKYIIEGKGQIRC
ncbi:MAG: glutamate-5-semialdehyde dehydrogenase [Clostridia bacterium]|nr:glutamate-5-semialdehyde dehydrogenase [Clostridia bacterium]